MDNNYIKSTKQKNNKYVSKTGYKWSDEEEKQLLLEIYQNINNENIAILHNRTIGSIKSRIRTIAYNMFINKISMDTIIEKTRLTEKEIINRIYNHIRLTIIFKHVENEEQHFNNENMAYNMFINKISMNTIIEKTELTETEILYIICKQIEKQKYKGNEKKWSDEEEKQLLLEIYQNINNENIAILHNRTIGSIKSRIRTIAYNMFINKISMDTIIEKTRLTEKEILYEIFKRVKKDKHNGYPLIEKELSSEEKKQLLLKISQNNKIKDKIICRKIKFICYDMFINGISLIEIMDKTKMNKKKILNTIVNIVKKPNKYRIIPLNIGVNIGKKWLDEEEKQLLLEISQNINYENIAILHNRTIGSIKSRIRTIAYNMFINKISMDTIIEKTRLTEKKIINIKRNRLKEKTN